MLHELRPCKGARKSIKRLGRGPGSGLGKTSGKGHKGQLARSGGGVRVGFEGGQIPFFQRIPKRGFHNFNKKNYSLVNLKDLEKFENNTLVTSKLLLQKRILKNISPSGVKILGNSLLTKILHIKVAKCSKQARKMIECVGGKIELESI